MIRILLPAAFLLAACADVQQAADTAGRDAETQQCLRAAAPAALATL